MEIIGVILMVIFALVSASDKKKKAARLAEQRRTGADGQAAPAAQKPARQLSMAEQKARMEALQRRKVEREAQRAAQTPVMPSNAADSFESSLTQLKELLDVAAQPTPVEGESMMADADCAGGSMPHDHAEGSSALKDAECAGGSMPHRHTQGVSRTAQSRRLSELDHDWEAEDAQNLVPSAFDARAMRRAVVMAEVLGKPKALKRA